MTKQKQFHRHREQMSGCQKGQGWEEEIGEKNNVISLHIYWNSQNPKH